jgi:hypothetical protein
MLTRDTPNRVFERSKFLWRFLYLSLASVFCAIAILPESIALCVCWGFFPRRPLSSRRI